MLVVLVEGSEEDAAAWDAGVKSNAAKMRSYSDPPDIIEQVARLRALAAI